MKNSRIWSLKGSKDQECTFKEQYGFSPVMCTLLKNRGIDSVQDLQKFIHPELENLYDPFLLPDMNEAVKKIKDAFDCNKKITIYGDYDADGVTSTSILYKFLKSAGCDVNYYIPNRFDEGYGLNKDALDEIIKYGSKLVITVDCGISSIEEVEYCKKSGADIIITDHHECGSAIPDTLVINPKRKDSVYPFSELSGAGVAFKLIEALSGEFNDTDAYEYIDLVSIGTIADIVPLVDENRVLVKYGLEKIRNTKNYGITALAETAGILLESITSRQVGYTLAPRINAAGRMGSAKAAVKLFTTDDKTEALKLSRMLCDANSERQKIEEKIFNEADEMIKENDNFVIVLEAPNWHIGVIGIVASKLTEKYNRPVVLLSRDGKCCRGSARSVPGFNIYEAFLKCSDLLLRFGGHSQAAGLSIEYELIPEFDKRINAVAFKMVSKIALAPVLSAECIIDADDMTLKLADEIKLLEPFGMDNPVPVFIYNEAVIDDIKTVGAQDKHLKIRLKCGENTVDAIAFNMGYNIEGYKRQDFIDLAFSINKNVWNERENVQLVVKDMRKSIFKGIQKNYIENLEEHLERLYNSEGMKNDDSSAFDIRYMSIDDCIKEASQMGNALILASSFKPLLCLLEYKGCINFDFKINTKGTACTVNAVICPDVRHLCYDGIDRIYILDNIVDYKSLSETALTKKIKCIICSPDCRNDRQFINSIMPLRCDMEKVYLYLKHNCRNGSCEFNMEALSYELSINIIKLYFSVKSLVDLNIFSICKLGSDRIEARFNPYNKNPMENSHTVKIFQSIMHTIDSLNIPTRNT